MKSKPYTQVGASFCQIPVALQTLVPLPIKVMLLLSHL